MRQRYSYAPCRSGGVSADYVVHEVHADGQSARILCYCYGEAAAREIATALNLLDHVSRSLEGSRT